MKHDCLHCLARSGSWLLSLHSWLRVSLLLVLLDTSLRSHRCVSIIGSGFRAMLSKVISSPASSFSSSARHRRGRAGRAADASVFRPGRLAEIVTGFAGNKPGFVACSAGELSSREQGERSNQRSRSHECVRQRARRGKARPLNYFDMLLRVTALAAVATATAPPFITSKELRPAARRTQYK